MTFMPIPVAPTRQKLDTGVDAAGAEAATVVIECLERDEESVRGFPPASRSNLLESITFVIFGLLDQKSS
ncbi:hypothetical protein [Sinorhizobium meliloti]|nr:hypothetical protein [Sinorhizobium meliloti]